MGVVGLVFVGAWLWAQDYKAVPGGAPPVQLDAQARRVLQSRGARVVDPSGFLFCEAWLRTEPISEGLSLAEAVASGSVPPGTLVGAIRFLAPGADRSGRGFGPGLYTLRQAEGDGVLMIKAEDDPGPEPAPVEQLEALSRKVTRGEAPALLRLSRAAPGTSPRLRITREGEWILEVTPGEGALALLIVGVAK